MLTLAGSRNLGAFAVFRDVLFVDGARVLTPRFYALPDQPRLARDEDGGPAFRFLRYRSLETSAATAAGIMAGGLLSVTVDLSPTDEQRSDLRARIAREFVIADPRTIDLQTVLVQGGKATLSFAGETGATASGQIAASGLVQGQMGGTAQVALSGAARVSFAIELSSDGAALLASAIERGLDVLLARFDFDLEYRLDGISLRVWCDARRAHAVAAARAASGAALAGVADGPGALADSLVASQAAGVEVLTDGTAVALVADETARLERLGHDLLAAALASAVLPTAAGGGQPSAPDATTDLALNHTFTASYPALAHFVVDGPLTLRATDVERATRVLAIDVGAGSQTLAVTVVCPVDFGAGLVAAVHVWFAYRGTAADGSSFLREADVVLREGAPEHLFRVDATPAERSYGWRATVSYRDGSSAEITERTSDETVLVIDVERLGVLSVTVALADVPLAAVARVLVDLSYPSRGLSHQLVLDGATPAGAWQVVVGDRDLAAWRYRTTWILADGRRVEEDARASNAPRVFLDAPRDLVPSRTVQAIAAADFSDVAQIVLELRVSPDPASDHALYTFTAAGQSASFTPLLSPGAALRYQARRTIVERDGTSTILEYTDEDGPILVVSDVLRYRVQLVARLLDLGGAFTLALVTLAYDDEASGRHAEDVVTVTGRDDEPVWSVRIGAPDRHRYRYQLTLVARDGARHAGNWVDAESEILVLRPLDETS